MRRPAGAEPSQWYGSNHNWTLIHDHVDMLIGYGGSVLLSWGLVRSHKLRAIARTASQRPNGSPRQAADEGAH